MHTSPINVPDMLREQAAVYEEKQKEYGHSYKQFGILMNVLFPNGLHLQTVQDYNRYGIITQMVTKLVRYTNNFDKGGHEDSLIDLAVYTTMLRELDGGQNNI